MKQKSLKNWLSFLIEQTKLPHANAFEQASKAAAKLQVMHFDVPVISVTGTNGKGSCVAVLESILIAAGYKVGAYTSPHLFEFNERIRVSGNHVSDELLCHAFERVFQECCEYQLNFFSFITMAALLIFRQEQCDVIILEVGIGGRLDATNVVENDLVVITTVGLDHCELLGDSIEKIAFEKAGLIKKNKAVVFGGGLVPQAVIDRAREQGAVLYISRHREAEGRGDPGEIKNLFRVEHDIQLYQYVASGHEWFFQHKKINYDHLPIPSIFLTNAASALMALEHLRLLGLLEASIPPSRAQRADPGEIKKLFRVEHEIHSGLASPEKFSRAICAGLANVFLPCRCQIIPGDITLILDVAHNEQAAELLAKKILELKPKRVWAVFSVLGRKDVQVLLKLLKPLVNRWFIAPMRDPESATTERLSQALLGCELMGCDSIQQAYESAKNSAEQGDLIVVFGSFRMFNEISQIKDFYDR